MRIWTLAFFAFLSAAGASDASANYRCYNWQVQSIGKEAGGTEFFYLTGGACRKYRPGENPYQGPVVPKKNPFFKVTFEGATLDTFVRSSVLGRTDVYERFLEFDLSDRSFENSPEELGIDVSSRSLLFVNLISSRIEKGKSR